MRKIAFIYDGQGSQIPGMGKDLYEAFPQVRKYFDRSLNEATVSQFAFQASDEVLGMTQYTQPALIAFDLAVSDILKLKGIEPQATAGLSIGEYAALTLAGVITSEEAQKIAQIRGDAMAKAVTLENGSLMETSMLAVMGVNEETITPLLKDSGVYIANLNAPGQVVIAGKCKDIEAMQSILSSAGARKMIPLKVSGPFHTPYMETAGQVLSDLFKIIRFRPPCIDLALNTTGQLANQDTDIRSEMIKQVQSTTRFESDLRALIETGVTHFIEIGNKGTLKGFMKRIDRKIPVYSACNLESIDALCTQLEEKSD